MKTAKHTPGPWRFEWDGDEAVIIGRPSWPCNRHGVNGEWQVAVTDDLLGEYPEEAEANAYLLTAALDLFSALNYARSLIGPDEIIDAAIAKASGHPVSQLAAERLHQLDHVAPHQRFAAADYAALNRRKGGGAMWPEPENKPRPRPEPEEWR